MPAPSRPPRIRPCRPALAWRWLAATALAAALAGPAAAQSAGDLDASLSFAPSEIASGKPSQLRVRLINTNDGTIGGIRYDVVLPPPMRMLPGADPTQCRGTVTPTADGYQFRGGSLGFDPSTCTVAVDVTADTDKFLEIRLDVGPIDSRNGTVRNVFDTLAVQGGIAPKITSPRLPAVLLTGVPFVHPVTVTGTAPVAVTASGLPPGLAYDDATRRVTGTPTAIGAYVVTLRATNGVAPPDAQVSNVEVRHPPLTIVTPPPLAPAPIVIGVPASFLVEANGGVPDYVFDLAAGALPPGLALSTSGAIAGTPVVPGAYAFTVRVVDALGSIDTRAYELVVTRIRSRILATIAPNPAVSGQTVTVRGMVVPDFGPPPPGTLDAWVAGIGQRCPDPFESGPDPVTPIAKSASLAAGIAELAFEKLPVGPYRVCARYNGGPLHDVSSVGPLDLFVIKGILLAAPKLELRVPDRVAVGASWEGVVRVASADGAPLAGARVRVRVGTADLGEVDVLAGEARFRAVAPPMPGAIAVSASTAGGPGFGPAATDPRWVAVVAKADAAVAIPATGAGAWVALAFALAGLGVGRLARRRPSTGPG